MRRNAGKSRWRGNPRRTSGTGPPHGAGCLPRSGTPAFPRSPGRFQNCRCPQMAAWTSYCIYKGEGPFNTPIVYAPYMPFMLVDHLPVMDNVLKHQAFAALWSGLKTVVQKYITKLVIDTTTNKPEGSPDL